MARKYTCKGPCGEKFLKEDLVEKNSPEAKTKILWCKSCMEKFEAEAQERNKLYDTIIELYGVTFPSGKMLKQIKTYKDDYKYTYSGMELTLRYCESMSWVKFNEQLGIGIIAHYYDKARIDLEEKNKRIASYIDVSKKIETIKIRKLDNTNHHKNGRLIDLEELLND